MMAITMKLIWFLFIVAVVTCIVAMVFLLVSTFGSDKDKGWHRCYRCKKCGAVYDPDKVPYICKYCGAEITKDHDIFSVGHSHKTADLNFDHDVTDDCEIVIARKIGRRWEIMKKELEK